MRFQVYIKTKYLDIVTNDAKPVFATIHQQIISACQQQELPVPVEYQLGQTQISATQFPQLAHTLGIENDVVIEVTLTLDDQLIIASGQMDCKQIPNLLTAGANPNTKNRDGSPIIMIIAKNAHFPDAQKAMELLLEQKQTKVDATDNRGNSTLMYLVGKDPCTESDNNLVASLLDHKPNVNLRNDDGDSALLILLRRYHKVAEDWKSATAKTQSSLLVEGPYQRRIQEITELIRRLLAHGALVDNANDAGETPLKLAQSSFRGGAIVTLLQGGQQPGLKVASQSSSCCTVL